MFGHRYFGRYFGSRYFGPGISEGQVLSPSLLVDADTFHPATVSASYTVAPALFVDADTFYAPAIRQQLPTAPPSPGGGFYLPRPEPRPRVVVAVLRSVQAAQTAAGVLEVEEIADVIAMARAIAPAVREHIDEMIAPLLQAVRAASPGDEGLAALERRLAKSRAAIKQCAAAGDDPLLTGFAAACVRLHFALLDRGTAELHDIELSVAEVKGAVCCTRRTATAGGSHRRSAAGQCGELRLRPGSV